VDEELYERTLYELRAIAGDHGYGIPIGVAMLLSIQEEMRRLVAKNYNVPFEWVNLQDVRFTDDRQGLICEGFTIWPGGLDIIT
jgi:hypothetical protein